MTTTEHLLTIAAEECAEVAQRISKALRFGLSEIQPDQPLTNAERIMEEFDDLRAVVLMLQKRQILPNGSPSQVSRKIQKVEQFLDYSGQCGTVTA